MRDVLSETRSTYDQIATEYAARARVGSVGLGEDVGWFRRSVPDDGWIADVGCGPGRDTTLLRDAGLRVIGLDLSAGQLQAGGLSGVAQADMRSLPLQSFSMDGIWCVAALLHLPRPTVPEVLAEFARVVRPGGTLCLTVAEGDGEGFEEAATYGSTLRRWFTYHRKQPLTEMMVAVGFTVLGIRRESTHRDWLQLCATRCIAEQTLQLSVG